MSVPINDPDDAIIAQTAIAGNADAICTLDKAFFTQGMRDFLQFKSILVYTDTELLKRLAETP